MARAQYVTIDGTEYPIISGLEGPFRFPSGAVLYYDPQEGKYYDRGADIYLDAADVSLMLPAEWHRTREQIRAESTTARAVA